MEFDELLEDIKRFDTALGVINNIDLTNVSNSINLLLDKFIGDLQNDINVYYIYY